MLECGLLVRPAVRGVSVTTQGASLFQPVRRSRVSTDIVRQIQDLIAAEHLQPGDRLPGEREVADALSVSRQSVREALRVLDYPGGVGVPPGGPPVRTRRCNSAGRSCRLYGAGSPSRPGGYCGGISTTCAPTSKGEGSKTVAGEGAGAPNHIPLSRRERAG